MSDRAPVSVTNQQQADGQADERGMANEQQQPDGQRSSNASSSNGDNWQGSSSSSDSDDRLSRRDISPGSMSTNQRDRSRDVPSTEDLIRTMKSILNQRVDDPIPSEDQPAANAAPPPYYPRTKVPFTNDHLVGYQGNDGSSRYSDGW